MSGNGISPEDEARFWSGVAYTSEFFMRKSTVHRAMEKLARILEEEDIPYAIVGGMALNEYGYVRATVDVDVLLTREGLAAFKSRWLGRGYVEKFAGSKGLRDTENGVTIDVLLAGEYPGDGRPKPVAFPDPGQAARRGEGVRLLPLERIIELKIASGMSAAHRIQDLADVIALVRACQLPVDFSTRLDPSVRDKFGELWDAAQTRDAE